MSAERTRRVNLANEPGFSLWAAPLDPSGSDLRRNDLPLKGARSEDVRGEGRQETRGPMSEEDTDLEDGSESRRTSSPRDEELDRSPRTEVE